MFPLDTSNPQDVRNTRWDGQPEREGFKCPRCCQIIHNASQAINSQMSFFLFRYGNVPCYSSDILNFRNPKIVSVVEQKLLDRNGFPNKVGCSTEGSAHSLSDFVLHFAERSGKSILKWFSVLQADFLLKSLGSYNSGFTCMWPTLNRVHTLYKSVQQTSLLTVIMLS